jgi:phenylacetate-CoA ligase
MTFLEQQWPNVRAVLQQAQQSPFYRQKYQHCPAVHCMDSFRQLPFLSRQELYDNTYPRSTDMLTCPVAGMIVTSTGGSSGLARYTVMTHGEWDSFAGVQAEALKKLGINSADMVANLMVAGSLWPSFVGVHDVLRLVGASHLPLSANIDLDRIMAYCLEFQPTVMLSLPTLFVFLADKALQQGVKFERLRMIGYAGEHMSKEVRQHIRRALGVESIKALAYTSADAGLMGYQCLHCAPNAYHLPTHFQCLEVMNMEENRRCEPGETGEILVTNLARFSMPIIRYRIGDLATMQAEPCPCGDPNPLFLLQGRSGEDFKLGGAYISMGVVEQAVGRVAGSCGISMNHSLELEDVGNQMIIRLWVEAGDPDRAQQQSAVLQQALKAAIPEIQVGLERSYIQDCEIRFVPLGSLQRSPITGKVKHLNDKRIVE